MTTLDLSTTPPDQWAGKIFGALSTITAEKSATIQRQGALRALKSRERGLMAELNDVRERITYLEDANYTRFPHEEASI